MNTTYDVEKWADETVRGRHIFNYHFKMDGSELRGWVLLKTTVVTASQDIAEKAYLWQRKDAPQELVRIDIAETPHWRLAQDHLREILSLSMRPDIPRGTGQLSDLGDVSFVARESQSDVPAAILFTVGNICVCVRSVERRTVDVSEIAIRLGLALGEPPASREIEKKYAREKRVSVSLKAGQPYKLFKNLDEEVPANTWLKIVVPQGELGRDRKALVYNSGESGEIKLPYYLVLKK